MKHSFIVPRKKRVISGELRLVIFFFSVSIAMLASAYGFLFYKSYAFQYEKTQAAVQLKTYEKGTADAEERIAHIETQIKTAERIATDNTVMKESIRNLFDLVPDAITLTQADLESKSLILYGKTPTKENYEYLLHAPLRSIFSRSYTSFYPIENGWYRFVSSNYLDDENETEVIQ